MFPEFTPSFNVFLIDNDTGEKIATTTLQDAQIERTIDKSPDTYNFLTDGISMTLEYVEFDQNIINYFKESNQVFDVELTSPKLNKLIAIHRRTKKKRIKKKLQKRIMELDHWISHNKVPMRMSQIEFK